MGNKLSTNCFEQDEEIEDWIVLKADDKQTENVI